MNTKFFVAITLSITLSLVMQASALQQKSNGICYLGWKKIETTHNLPNHPIGIAASTDENNGDYVAIANDGSADNFYFLDHAHHELGWQKTGCFLQANATGIFYGLGRFFALGVDRGTQQPVIATSVDNGKTWSQKLVLGGTSSYDNAAFSDQFGMMTGKAGAVATTVDGNNWFETTPPSGNPKKIIATNISPGSSASNYKFELFSLTPTEDYGFLTLHDAPMEGTLYSFDGRTWRNPLHFPITSNQLLIYENKGYFVYQTNYWVSTTDEPLSSNYIPIDPKDETLPAINLSSFTCYGGYFVGLGTNSKTGASLSLLAPLELFNGNNIVFTDFLPTSMAAVAGCQHGFVAIADDGTSYYASAEIESEAPSLPTK